ncbi:arginine decarboxylase [Rhodanobacter thiooxydans]|uniref:Biosynthetic arginine decarboxylase n=1 Tax=Rhodanobacter thiooxydans TaxID=416169 RepID=A0A154QM88_9GAMM|nr:biosynthetic arginine decarboxylase [Rhodanobacter thiooxydans]EIL96979.1 arginine decarboxylase [Rhodanobacter thiooxydans LCS2]KZC25112.1 arginine decarboxylase [Rhodanobacter thiooxydans]MCW0203241.1 biosynthetic arginine decarboxylase [Rhodanobacter thiooxydans]
MANHWTVDTARHTYAVPHWGDGYVDVDEAGCIVMRPRGAYGPALSLPRIVERACAEGLRLPLLVRFPDILADRLARLQTAFAKAIDEWHYAGGYTAIYPIKVNQQRGVAGELVAAGVHGFGLEAGSKPELMAVLAMARPGSIVICNGYKDREYIRLALIGKKLGLRVHIVIEKLSELDHVFAEARALGVEPLLGVRVRLASIGAGKWQNTGGDKGKFGLSPNQVLTLVERLDHAGLKHTLKLQHFHMGSQISNVRDIANGMREATRYFVELCRMGVPLEIVDVGGGLGVDYEGSRSRSHNSINYSIEQYASTIVQSLAEAVAAEGLEAPHILTEAGRAMTAHHAVMVVNVTEVEEVPAGAIPPPCVDEPAVLRRLRETWEELDRRPALELFHEAQHHLSEGQALYALGQLALADRARLDEMYYAIAGAVRLRLLPAERSHRQALDELDEKLVDKYFANFSVFESIPDVWAIGQIFPIAPIARLDEQPTRRGVIVDLTCDSDGRIDHYVDAEGVDVSLPLHALRDGESYRLGIFMVGAYQETLGDIHNLFGDTDAVNVRVDGDGYTFAHVRRGDTTDLMLDYVGYDLETLRASYRERIAAAGLAGDEAARLYDALDGGLAAYTYLAEDIR